MRKIFNICVVLLFVLCSSVSCIKDNTNTNFKTVILPDSIVIVDVTNPDNTNPSRVKLINIGDSFIGSFNCFSGEEIKLEANVFYEGPYDIEYEWLMDGKLISNEKIFSTVPIAPSQLILNIKRTGGLAGADYRIRLNVTHRFASGIFVMGKHEGKTILDFYRQSSVSVESDVTGKPGTYKIPHFEVVDDVFKLYNESDLPCTDPIGMAWIKSKVVTTYGYGIQMLDRDYRKSVTILAASVKENAKLSDEWVGMPENITLKSMGSLRYSNVLVSEQENIYLRTNYDYGMPNTGRYSSVPLGYNDPNDNPDKGWQKLDVTQYCMTNFDTALGAIYEKKNKRFLALVQTVNAYELDLYPDKIEVMKFPTIALEEGHVDMNNFDKEVVYLLPEGGAILSNANLDIIYKEGEKLRVQGVKLSYNTSSGLKLTIGYNSEISAELTAILKAEDVVFIKDKTAMRQPELCIAAGKKVYVSNISGTSIEELGTFDTKITNIMKMMPWTTSSATEANYFSGRILGIGFENGDYKVIKFYKDPNQPGKILQTVLAEKNYSGGVVDAKYIYSNVIMVY